MNSTEETLVTREDFEAWIELLPVELEVEVSQWNRSDLRVEVILPNGVELTLKFRTIKLEPTGKTYYGLHDDWNRVRVYNYHCDNYSARGSGSRSPETTMAAERLLVLLNPNTEQTRYAAYTADILARVM